MNEEEFETLKTLLYTDNLSQYGKRKLVELVENCFNEIDKQQKEILHWKGQYYLISRKINKPLEDKIKAKIKELENKENLYKEEKRFNEEEIKFNYAKRVLQELLGEGE